MSKRKADTQQTSKYSITLADSDDDDNDETENDVIIKNKPKNIDGEIQRNKLSAIQQAHKDKLSGSRFRVLNEELYTTTSEER
jgi:hypothetical protein